MRFGMLPLLWMVLGTNCIAGPFSSFSDPAGRVTPDQVNRWAASVVDYSPAPGVAAGFAVPSQALGIADGVNVALGDLDATQIAGGILPGSITLELRGTMFNGPGADLALFENAGTFFTDPYVFAELAYVEVSSNGTDFARFPAISLNIEPDDNGTLDPNELDIPFGRDFAGIDSTNVHNLAGIHPTGFGTPFDLAELQSHDLVLGGQVDLSSIRFVRIVDIPGNGAYLDADGRPILDTWPTAGSGGFDLDAVGAIHSVPEPGSLVTLGMLSIWLLANRRRTKIPIS